MSSGWVMSIVQLQCAAGYKLVYFTMNRDRCASVIHTCVSSARHDPAKKSHPVIIYSKWHTHLSQCFLTHLILQLQICHWVPDLINRHTETPPRIPTLETACRALNAFIRHGGRKWGVSLSKLAPCKIPIISEPQMWVL